MGCIACLAACGCLTTGTTFWSLSLVAEVHTLNCLLLTLTFLATLTAGQQPSVHSFALYGVAAGLLMGHRNMNVLFVLPLSLLLESALRTGRQRRLRVWLSAAGAALATGMVYLYLPLAARGAPVINPGNPSTFSRLYAVATAAPYFRHLGTGPWQTVVGRVFHFAMRLPSNLGVAALAVPFGAATWFRRGGGRPLLTLASTVVACVGFAAFYNVIDIGAYFLPAILCFVVLAALGMDLVPSPFRVALPLLALILLPLNFHTISLRRVRVGEWYAHDLLRSAPSDAVMVTFGDTARNVVLYGQAVGGERADVVTVDSGQLSDVYLEQLRARHPAVDWPNDSDSGTDWLSFLVERNSQRRAVCLTLPVPLELPDWEQEPHGLLFCFKRRNQPARLASSVAFWETVVVPSRDDLLSGDVHLDMVAMAYAAARFDLARALAAGDDLEGARRQLRALVDSNPDASELAISKAKETIGQRLVQPLAYGARARRALQAAGNDRSSLLAALAQE